LRFLADESCDVAVVSALRAAGYDVSAIVEVSPGAQDAAVLALARTESRVLVTEDKDFGLLAYAGGQETTGVVLKGVRRHRAWPSPTLQTSASMNRAADPALLIARSMPTTPAENR
jgi:hypothetical protein